VKPDMKDWDKPCVSLVTMGCELTKKESIILFISILIIILGVVLI